jgi:hypothetical protein
LRIAVCAPLGRLRTQLSHRGCRGVKRAHEGLPVSREVEEPSRRFCELLLRGFVPFILLAVRMDARRPDDLAAVGLISSPSLRLEFTFPPPSGSEK